MTNDDPSAAPPVKYGWLPPAQTVGGGMTVFTVPAGYIHQSAWSQNGGPDIQGVYAYPNSGWESMVWRWADTMRSSSILQVAAPGGHPAYRVELTPTDGPSPGTAGNHPRAEFFSVDPAEKRRERPAPPSNFLREGDEYWATFALYIPVDFPTNHLWATLFQRKFQDTASFPAWLTLNVHGTTLDVTVPGNTPDKFVPIATLSEVTGRWVQFVVHEKLSSGSDGLAELGIVGNDKMSVSGHPTVPSGDVNFHFQYGYYRSNDPAPGQTQGPGLGYLYYTPLLIKRAASEGDVPALPGGSSAMRIGAGNTPKGQTNWQDYPDNGPRLGIYVDVDTSSAGFSSTPIYVSSIGGDKWHWATTGSSAIYNPSATGFRVYIRWSSNDAGPNPPTSPDSQFANQSGWHINWIGWEP